MQLKIDQITGQISYLNKQVAESTIKVDLHEPDAAVANTTNDDDPTTRASGARGTGRCRGS